MKNNKGQEPQETKQQSVPKIDMSFENNHIKENESNSPDISPRNRIPRFRTHMRYESKPLFQTIPGNSHLVYSRETQIPISIM
jgi:hypothetical protein